MIIGTKISITHTFSLLKGDATVGVKVRCDKVQMLRKQLKHEREAKIKLQDISDKNLKTVAMLTDHVEK